MVEFRRDLEGRPVLMEVNPRMGGSVALAVRCGVDFPSLTYAWATGRPLCEVRDYAVGRRVRWLSGDIWSLKSAFARVRGPDVPHPAPALARFFADFIMRPSALEPFDFSDPVPAFIDWREIVLRPALRRMSAAARHPFGWSRER